MEQYEANELHTAQAEVERLTRRLDSLTDVLRAAQRLIDAIEAQNTMTRPNLTQDVSHGGPYGQAYAGLIEALNSHHNPNGGNQ